MTPSELLLANSHTKKRKTSKGILLDAFPYSPLVITKILSLLFKFGAFLQIQNFFGHNVLNGSEFVLNGKRDPSLEKDPSEKNVGWKE